MKLYIYDHCPFCVKTRMIFGLKNIPVELIVMLSDDVATPEKLIGQKMAPILMKEDGSCMPESLDIVEWVDKRNGEPLLTGSTNPAISEWLRRVNGYLNKLLLPRIAAASFAEFATPEARRYFHDKKEASQGSFDELKKHADGYIKNVNDDLRKLDKLIVQPNAVNGELSLWMIFTCFRCCVRSALSPGLSTPAAWQITATIWPNRPKSICYLR